MTKWEYLLLHYHPSVDVLAELNALGEEGWEVAGVTGDSRAPSVIILKRRRG